MLCAWAVMDHFWEMIEGEEGEDRSGVLIRGRRSVEHTTRQLTKISAQSFEAKSIYLLYERITDPVRSIIATMKDVQVEVNAY